MDEENQEPRARVSRSFIFSIIIVAAIIGLLAWIIFSNIGHPTTLNPQEFATQLYNGNIKDAEIRAGNNMVYVSGKAKQLNDD